jgi:hypothetical protein
MTRANLVSASRFSGSQCVKYVGSARCELRTLYVTTRASASPDPPPIAAAFAVNAEDTNPPRRVRCGALASVQDVDDDDTDVPRPTMRVVRVDASARTAEWFAATNLHARMRGRECG